MIRMLCYTAANDTSPVAVLMAPELLPYGTPVELHRGDEYLGVFVFKELLRATAYAEMNHPDTFYLRLYHLLVEKQS